VDRGRPVDKVRLSFVPRNWFGLMDHDVKLESGVTIRNLMRVVPNGEGSEFVVTLIRQPGMSDGQFAKDKAAVENDLKALKDLLESKSNSCSKRCPQQRDNLTAPCVARYPKALGITTHRKEK